MKYQTKSAIFHAFSLFSQITEGACLIYNRFRPFLRHLLTSIFFVPSPHPGGRPKKDFKKIKKTCNQIGTFVVYITVG